MNRFVSLALAVMLAVLNGYAQQPAYKFAAIVPTGATVGGHILTAIDGVTLSDSAEIALVAHWNEGRRNHSGVFTSTRVVAEEGNIDGKYVVKILPACLAINALGLVAWEGLYVEGPITHTGLFLERKLIVTLTTAGSPLDFALADDGHITLMAAVAAPNAPIPGAPAADRLKAIRTRLPKRVTDIINRPNSPIQAPDPNTIIHPPATARPQPTPQVTKVAAPPARTCPAPDFPYPPLWIVGADEMSGPLAYRIADVSKGHAFDSHSLGHIAAPFRIVHYNVDCKPLLIVLGDTAAPDRFEAFTPKGLLTRTKEGALELPGYSGIVSPEDFIKGDEFLRINKRGQVLFADGSALLLASPTRSH